MSHLSDLSDIQDNVIRLHALAQGASVIYEAVCAPRSEASNSLHAQLAVLVELADRIGDDLARLEARMKS